MTTIAYDGKSLCVDSQVTSGNFVFGSTQKIFRLKDNRILAAAGTTGLIHSVVAWLNEEGDEPEIEDNEGFSGILLHPDGTVEEITNELRIWPACIPWSGGTGELIAMTAMKCGKTAREAVEIACELDLMTGGKIQEAVIIQA